MGLPASYASLRPSQHSAVVLVALPEHPLAEPVLAGSQALERHSVLAFCQKELQLRQEDCQVVPAAVTGLPQSQKSHPSARPSARPRAHQQDGLLSHEQIQERQRSPEDVPPLVSVGRRRQGQDLVVALGAEVQHRGSGGARLQGRCSWREAPAHPRTVWSPVRTGGPGYSLGSCCVTTNVSA